MFASEIAYLLNSKLKHDVEFLEFKFVRAETYGASRNPGGRQSLAVDVVNLSFSLRERLFGTRPVQVRVARVRVRRVLDGEFLPGLHGRRQEKLWWVLDFARP